MDSHTALVEALQGVEKIAVATTWQAQRNNQNPNSNLLHKQSCGSR
jgi:hypothetical protein